ncbi:hypothetical protein HK405_000042, partial [Cladochytrium tenue]
MRLLPADLRGFRQRVWRPALAVLAGGAVVFVLVHHAATANALLMRALEYIDAHKAIGSVLFVFLFTILSCLLVPITFLTIAAGVIFQPLAAAVGLVLLASQ